MKLKELKKWINKLPVEQLEKELLYNSEEYSISGVVQKISIAKSNLYYTGDDDPAKLYSKGELKEDGFSEREIKEFDIEIHKGDFVLTF